MANHPPGKKTTPPAARPDTAPDTVPPAGTAPEDPPAVDPTPEVPPAPETSEPSTEGGPRTVLATDDTAVIVDSPGPETDPSFVPGPDGGRRECVVPGGHHVGAAVPGSQVCSYHTVWYRTDGTRRSDPLPDGSKKGDKTA